jgi:pimeloyl-ACP methyl ester carboxylesterase
MRPTACVFAICTIALAAAAALAETPPAAPPPALAPSSLSPPPTPSSADAALEAISLDAAASARHYRVRNWIRQRVVSDCDLAKYCLQLDDDWQQAPADKPVAVLIHGFNSTPARNAGLLTPVRAARFPCATFAYPNDYTLPASAELLSKQLRDFARQHPDRRVALICHSTGGLVARACVEDPALDPGNVDRLIMIAPPTHGSQLARFACGSDVWEHWLSRKQGGPWARAHDSIVDGLGEAADELCPQSPFLAALNGRPRNPHVRYSILLGTQALVTDAELVWLRENVCQRLRNVPGVDNSAERLDALVADMDELVEGKGDGVVAVKRGRLEGVEDTLILPFGHLAVGRQPEDAELQALYQQVLSRLK